MALNLKRVTRRRGGVSCTSHVQPEGNIAYIFSTTSITFDSVF